MTTTVAMGEPEDYLDALCAELARVGIRGALRERILAEAADHLVDGDVEDFGEPRLIAQRFADELATTYSRRAAFRGFVALAVAGLGFAAAWLLVNAAGGWPDLVSAGLLPLAVPAAVGMIVCPQVAFAAGLLALLRARRLRGYDAAPAAEVALLLRRTGIALAFGIGALLSASLYALVFRGELSAWWNLAVGVGGVVLAVPLAAVLRTVATTASLRTAVPGAAGDMFDDLPVRLPHRPWLACFALAGLVAFVALGAAGADEGPRNAVAEFVLVVACFAALGRRLGLRR
jgi:hypothetical protein